MKETLTIGQIINTHGVKGELKVFPLTDNTQKFKKIKKVLLDGEERDVLWCKLQNDKIILKLDGIDTMDAAARLKGKKLEIYRENAAKLPTGSYYVADIVGCRVVDTNGKKLGDVSNVIFTGSNEVYWVKGEKELMVPAIKSVVENIDIENSVITIKPVEVWNYED
ncbi:ribosome maturation factor RimM [Clostridium oryzae]|uniref:Ribosome maturation factor RimM n=1 Tax=Clostridium oryzae TaxID=1450648 RepID=A0A1V4IP19_9CLOT|nr:ribosome maturation factor RimM [Clostridium oryzae]OPJ61788.1 ribosome maturation factor RimM [Clostridium oryzae]